MTEAPPLLDRAIFDDLVAHLGPDHAPAVVELFIGECRDLVARIGEASRRGASAQQEVMRRAAHSLKSAAGQLGAVALAEAAAAIESATRFADEVAVLERCAAATEAVLTTLLACPSATRPCGDRSSTG